MKPLPTEDLEHILRCTEALWKRVRGQRIFVTGGTGFFGSWLLESLAFCNRRLDLNLSATVLSRDPEAFFRKMPHMAEEDSIRFLRGDLADFAFPGGHFDLVIHAATPTSGYEARAPGLPARVVTGMERMLAFARAARVRRFLFTSSGAVYGRQPARVSHLPESFAGKPDTPYGEAKLKCEQMCAESTEGHGMECAIARGFAFVGPHLPLDRHFAIGNFIGDVLAGRAIDIEGDGSPRRSYLYAADLAVWLWTILLRAPDLVPINVGSARDLSILELARVVAATLRPETAIRVAQQPCPGAAPARYVPSVERAREMLGLEEWTPLEESIRRTADWWRKQGLELTS